MDLMMRLQDEAFTSMADAFEAREEELGSGLPVLEFVNIMCSHLPNCKSESARAEILPQLMDLFNDIDVNGDGTLEFNELTSYLVEAGMMATRVRQTCSKYSYAENTKFFDRTTIGATIVKMQWITSLHILLVVEDNSKIVRVYNEEGGLVNDIQVAYRFNESGVGIEFLATENAKSKDATFSVLNTEYVPQLKLILVSCSDFTLTFWDTIHFHFVAELRAATAQIVLRWCSDYTLFTSGTDTVIHTWTIKSDIKRAGKVLVRHTDVVMDILEIVPHELVVSGGMDHKLFLWDKNDLHFRGSLAGHTTGVRQLGYASASDFLLSVSFEYTCRVWDLNSKTLVAELAPHKNPLIGVQVMTVSAIDHVITGDDGGVFKLWKISRNHPAAGLHLETFSTKSKLSKFHPNVFIATNTGQTLLAGGKKLRLFQSNRCAEEAEIPLLGVYNPTSNQFVAVTVATVVVSDGENGKCVDELKKVYDSEFLKGVVDDSCKKLILYTEKGSIAILNTVNFTVLTESKAKLPSIAGLHYSTKDQLIVVVTQEGSIHVLSDEEQCFQLRVLENAHLSTVVHSAFSQNASLIATSSLDCTIKFWDFATLNHDGLFSDSVCALSVLEFLNPFPILAAADIQGNILLIATRPHPRQGECLHAFRHVLDDVAKVATTKSTNLDTFLTRNDSDIVDEEEKAEVSFVSSMKWCMNEETQEGFLFTGDEGGNVHVWDLTKTLQRLGIEPIAEKHLLWKQRGYFTHARCHKRHREKSAMFQVCGVVRKIHTANPKLRRHISSAATEEEKEGGGRRPLRSRQHVTYVDIQQTQVLQCWEPRDVKMVHNWYAHKDQIHRIEVMTIPQTIITHSLDCQILLWSWKGECWGSLLGNIEVNKRQWLFRSDRDALAHRKASLADSLLEKFEEVPTDGEKVPLNKVEYNEIHPLLRPVMEKNGLHRQKSKRITETVPLPGDRLRVSSLKQVSHSHTIEWPPSLDGETLTACKLNVTSHTHFWSIAEERRLKVQNFKGKTADLTPSFFLAEKLGLSPEGRLPLRKMHRSKSKQTVLGTSQREEKVRKNSHVLKSNNSRRKMALTPLKHVSSLINSNNKKQDGAISSYVKKLHSRRITRINDIIATAESGTDNEISRKESIMNALDRKLTDADLQRLAVTKSNFSEQFSIEQQEIYLRQAASASRKQEEKNRKAKRMQKYIDHKQRNINSELGTALRTTSFMLHSKTTDVSSDTRFGVLYTTKEVMAVIRLFWSLDYDNSGSIDCSELVDSKLLDDMGIGDVAAVFQSLDLDGSGDLTLDELLLICFPYARKAAVADMLQLAQLGRVKLAIESKTQLTAVQREELKDIFKMYDKDQSGSVSLDEIKSMICLTDGSGMGVMENELEKMFKDVDMDGNAELEVDEFIELLTGLYTTDRETT